ncbi:MAG: Smr/MutS family protein [Novosphingobium sp.]
MTWQRRLSRDEARLWAALAKTVKPFERSTTTTGPTPSPSPEGEGDLAAKPRPKPLPFREGVRERTVPKSPPSPSRPIDSQGLDASWERKLAKALVQPDFTLDLHGHSLEAAHRRLDMGLGQALAMGARVVLLITGRPRPAEAADRGNNRGAIRAKVLDWLALGPHASRIAAVRGAHRRHGGAGALYVVLRRPR